MIGPRGLRRLLPGGTRSALVASGVVGLGLLVSIAATGLPEAVDGSAGASLRLRLPDAVRLAVLVLLGLSGIAWLSLLGSRPVRGLDLAEYRRLRRRSLVAGLALPLAVLVYAVWVQRQEGGGQGIEAPLAAIRALLAQGGKPATSSTLFDLAAAALALGLALACFGLLALVALSGRVPWRRAREATPSAPATLRHSVAASLADLRADPDVRRAIVRAWLRFEGELARASAPRAPWQTASELMRAALGRLPLPPAPVERLTALFELARFSDRPLGPDARDVACDCLEEIGAALAPGATHAG